MGPAGEKSALKRKKKGRNRSNSDVAGLLFKLQNNPLFIVIAKVQVWYTSYIT
jgi:hypothetical protein